jgi:probable HAF family extracellular repeat protein
MNKFLVLMGIAALSLILAGPAPGAMILDTGPSPEYHWMLSKTQWLAGKFTTTQAWNVGAMRGDISTIAAGAVNVTIYTDASNLPGTPVFTKTFQSQPAGFKGWQGTNGFAGILAAGSYWIAFEVPASSTFDGDYGGLTPPLSPMSPEAGKQGGPWYSAGSLNLAARIESWSGSASPRGKMTDLGTPADWTRSYAYGINNNGQIVGHIAASNFYTEYNYAFLYSGGTWTGGETATLPGYGASYAKGINDNGQVVGYSSHSPDSAYSRACLDSVAGVMTDLGTLPGGEYSRAYGINNNGQVIGYSDFSADRTLWHAFLKDPGQPMTDLGTLGGKNSEAYAINNNGQIVGTAALPNYLEHAFLKDPGKPLKDLGTLGGIYGKDPQISCATAINNKGQIVGWSYTASGLATQIHAFSYSEGKMTDLGTLGGDTSEAYGINDSGQIVGWSKTASGEVHAFLYSGGVMTDLGTLPGGDTSYAYGINNKGQIVGWAGAHHAFLYNPQPKPSSLPGILPLLLGN